MVQAAEPTLKSLGTLPELYSRLYSKMRCAVANHARLAMQGLTSTERLINNAAAVATEIDKIYDWSPPPGCER